MTSKSASELRALGLSSVVVIMPHGIETLSLDEYEQYQANDKANRARLHAQLLIIAIIIGLYSCIAAICYFIAVGTVPVIGGLIAATGLAICSAQQLMYFIKL